MDDLVTNTIDLRHPIIVFINLCSLSEQKIMTMDSNIQMELAVLRTNTLLKIKYDEFP